MRQKVVAGPLVEPARQRGRAPGRRPSGPLREGHAGEPAALIRVELLRLAMAPQSRLRGLDTEVRLHELRSPASQAFALKAAEKPRRFAVS